MPTVVFSLLNHSSVSSSRDGSSAQRTADPLWDSSVGERGLGRADWSSGITYLTSPGLAISNLLGALGGSGVLELSVGDLVNRAGDLDLTIGDLVGGWAVLNLSIGILRVMC